MGRSVRPHLPGAKSKRRGIGESCGRHPIFSLLFVFFLHDHCQGGVLFGCTIGAMVGRGLLRTWTDSMGLIGGALTDIMEDLGFKGQAYGVQPNAGLWYTVVSEMVGLC